MRKIMIPLTLLLAGGYVQAQGVLQNNGNMQIHSGASLSSYGGFNNTASAVLLNNGNLYLKGAVTNDQPAMSSGSGILYLNGSAAQTVNGTQLMKTWQLVTNNAAGITLNNNLSVADVHTFTNGMVVTSATPNYVVYEAGASYTGSADARHVNGWVKKLGNTAFIFPVGNNSYERPVAVSNLSAASELNCRYRPATPNTANVQSPIMLVNPNEYWELNQVSGGTAQVTLNWDNTKVTFPSYVLTAIRSSWFNGADWVNEGGTATGSLATTGSITTNVVSSFGYFVIGSTSFVLPMHFISVSAQRKTGATTVRWQTARETNVAYYEVERLNASGIFNKIGSVKSNNSQLETGYEYIDALPLVGVAMYRIRSVDVDGQYTFSKVVSVSESNNTPGLQVLNNPAHEAIYITASDAYKGKYQYELLSAAGQLIQSGVLSISGNDVVAIPLSIKTTTGIYLLNIKNEERRFAKRIMVK
jgi:hypothetical protein